MGGKAEAENPQLLATCDAGTECRNKNEADMKSKIEAEWQKIITNFRSSVESAIENTEEAVNIGWANAVKCEEENPCCAFNAVEWQNMQTKIGNLINLHNEKTGQLEVLNTRI